jgi:hypothetical protein
MNLFLGVVIGVLLTIGTAFIADAFTTAEVTSEMCSKQIVNWGSVVVRMCSSIKPNRLVSIGLDEPPQQEKGPDAGGLAAAHHILVNPADAGSVEAAGTRAS